jgi:hypothetical protein
MNKQLPAITHVEMEKIVYNTWFTSSFKNKVFPILFPPGMRGNSICNIFQAHPEVFYLPDTASYKSSNYSAASKNDSLALEEELCRISGKGVIRDLATHASFHNYTNKAYSKSISSVVPYVLDKHSTNKLLFHITHPDEYVSFPYLTTLLDKLYNSNKVFIYLHGNVNRPFFVKKYYPPKDNTNAFNINVDMLYSKNYEEFECEYYKIINYFNLTTQINRVRAYILVTLERQNFFQKYHKEDLENKAMSLGYHSYY